MRAAIRRVVVEGQIYCNMIGLVSNIYDSSFSSYISSASFGDIVLDVECSADMLSGCCCNIRVLFSAFCCSRMCVAVPNLISAGCSEVEPFLNGGEPRNGDISLGGKVIGTWVFDAFK